MKALLSRSLNFYYNVKSGHVNLVKDYACDFQRNNTHCHGDNKIKVLYHH